MCVSWVGLGLLFVRGWLDFMYWYCVGMHWVFGLGEIDWWYYVIEVGSLHIRISRGWVL